MTSAEVPLPLDLTLPFLEQRSYLHGTTLLDALVARIPRSSAFVFKVSRRIESNRLRLIQREPHGHVDLAASLDWHRTDTKGSIGVVALAAAHPIKRDPYDESQITERIRYEAGSVTFTGDSPFTLVGTLIPMYKALLRVEHPVSRRGQWMFTRLDLDSYPATFAVVALRFDRIAGAALAKSEVMLNGRSAGALYFSWVDPS